jgi:hypothetical protein
MNNAQPDGRDMSFQVFKDSLKFLKDNHLCPMNLVISGGEPLECDSFDEFLNYFLDFSTGSIPFRCVTITTNGELILNDSKRFQEYIKRADMIGTHIQFQVSADVRYYPRRIPVHKRIYREPGFTLCDNCVEQIYPQGRALTNNIPWQSKASKCFNVRAITKQISNCTLADIDRVLASRLKFCTPHIAVDGSIKLGESDLCPACASIYDTLSEIIEKIRNFKCSQCDFINKQLPIMYRRLL